MSIAKEDKIVTNKYHALVCQTVSEVLPSFSCAVIGAFFTGVSGKVFKFRIFHRKDERSPFVEVGQDIFDNTDIENDLPEIFIELKDYFQRCDDDFYTYTIILKCTSNGFHYTASANRTPVRYLDTAALSAWKSKYLV